MTNKTDTYLIKRIFIYPDREGYEAVYFEYSDEKTASREAEKYKEQGYEATLYRIYKRTRRKKGE